MKAILLLFVLWSTLPISNQQDDWQKTRDWKIHNVRDRKAIAILTEDLVRTDAIALPKDSVLYFLKNAFPWPPEQKVVWMGAYGLTYRDSTGKAIKLLVSSYGGFFLDEGRKGYFQISEERKTAWNEWLVSYLNKMH